MLLTAVLVCLALSSVSGISPPLTEEEWGDISDGLSVSSNDAPEEVLQSHKKRAVTKHRYVTNSGHVYRTRYSNTIPVDGTSHVSDSALDKAANIVALMVKHMPSDVFQAVAKSHGVGIFTKSETATAFPENAHLADTPQCHGTCSGSCSKTCTSDGRKYAELAGLANSRAVALVDNVICSSSDPYGHLENILVHEFGHIILKFMPSQYRDRLYYVYNYAKTHHVWYSTYALSNADEYWAEATSSFFMTIKRPRTTGPAGGMNLCDNYSRVCSSETEARAHLKQHDPWLFDVLANVYTGGRPDISSGLRVCLGYPEKYLSFERVDDIQNCRMALDQSNYRILTEGVFGVSPPLSIEEKSELADDVFVKVDPNPETSLPKHHTKAGSKHRYVSHSGSYYHQNQPNTLNIDGSSLVSDSAMDKAAYTIALIVKNMPSDVFSGLLGSHGVGIFSKSESATVFPEYAHMADTPACRGSCSGSCSDTCLSDGRKIAEIAGVSDTRSCVLDDNVLCNSADPYNHLENILVHEFGHLVMKYMPSHYRDRLYYTYHYVKTHVVWYDTYVLSNADEYWAEATSSFFMTIRRPRVTSPAGGMNLCDHYSRLCKDEQEARAHLKYNDPWLFDILSNVYTNGHPEISSGLHVCM